MFQFWLAVLSLAALLASCGGEEEEENEKPKLTCKASIAPTRWDYIVDGNKLTITDNANNSVTIYRMGDGGDIYGIWLLGQDTNTHLNLTITGKMKVAEGKVYIISQCASGSRSATVQVVSNAEITDSTVTILEAKSKSVEF